MSNTIAEKKTVKKGFKLNDYIDKKFPNYRNPKPSIPVSRPRMKLVVSVPLRARQHQKSTTTTHAQKSHADESSSLLGNRNENSQARNHYRNEKPTKDIASGSFFLTKVQHGKCDIKRDATLAATFPMNNNVCNKQVVEPVGGLDMENYHNNKQTKCTPYHGESGQFKTLNRKEIKTRNRKKIQNDEGQCDMNMDSTLPATLPTISNVCNKQQVVVEPAGRLDRENHHKNKQNKYMAYLGDSREIKTPNRKRINNSDDVTLFSKKKVKTTQTQPLNVCNKQLVKPAGGLDRGNRGNYHKNKHNKCTPYIGEPGKIKTLNRKRLDDSDDGAFLSKKKVKKTTQNPPLVVLDNSNVDHDEVPRGMDKVVRDLEAFYKPLLYDVDGNKKRAAFLQLPMAVWDLLRHAWNLGNTPSKDCVTRHMRMVQSYIPNLKNYELSTPGFPPEVFKNDHARAIDAQIQLQHVLARKLKEIEYNGDNQTVQFYLTFLLSLSSIVQDPHIDFEWDNVMPSTSNNAVGIWTANAKKSQRRVSPRHQKVSYEHSVPFVAFFPLTDAGMTIELWKARKNNYSKSSNDDDVGVLVHIPERVMLIARGDVVHAGGLISSECVTTKPAGQDLINEPSKGGRKNYDNNLDEDRKKGDPRGHLYIYRTNSGQVHATNTINTYTKPNSTRRLDEIYRHCPTVQPAAVLNQTKVGITRVYEFQKHQPGSNNQTSKRCQN